MIFAARIAFAAVVLAGFTQPVFAYIGPGAGLGAVAAALGLLAAIVMAVGVVLLWPIRRLLRRRNRRAAVDAEGSERAKSTGSASKS